MKQIKSCPITELKCKFKKAGYGCTKHMNPNQCTHCTNFRKKQSEHTIKELKKYNRYRQPGCKL